MINGNISVLKIEQSWSLLEYISHHLLELFEADLSILIIIKEGNEFRIVRLVDLVSQFSLQFCRRKRTTAIFINHIERPL